MRHPVLLLALILSSSLLAQHTDTLRFHSEAFGSERTITVRTPTFHRYAATEVRMPVIVLLDGQHEWFIDPVLSDIHYLQYTHLVPQAIVVTVPLVDRVRECAPDSLGQTGMPLLRLLTEELPALLAPYHPSGYSVLVGHSFSASFALYALLQAPEAFDAIIALSPAHLVAQALPRAEALVEADTNRRVYVAVGGAERRLDGGHHAILTPVVAGLQGKGNGEGLLYREYPSAGHTSVPIIAFPELLATLFTPFVLRDSLAPVDNEYFLLAPPPSPVELLQQVDANLGFLGEPLPWEVAEINGLASRLENSQYNEQAIAVYRRATQLYPKLFDFHASLGALLLAEDRPAGLAALLKSLELLESEEAQMPERAEVEAQIRELME